MSFARAPPSSSDSALSSSPLLSSSPSVQPRNHNRISSSSLSLSSSSSSGKRQIACPLPLKIPFATKPIQAKSPLPQDGVNDFLDRRHGGEWESNLLLDDIIAQPHHPHHDDGDSLINLVEAEWELEQIFRTASVAGPANPQRRMAWMMNEEDPNLVEDHEPQFDASWINEDDLPRLGFSPLEMIMREELTSPMVSTPQLFVVPPSRARNPVPLNTPFQTSSAGGRAGMMVVDRDYFSSPFYGDSINRTDPNERMEDCSSFPNPSSPSLASSSPSSVLTSGGHMRKRNRSYSDSVLKRDNIGDLANNLVLVS
jgi:hypothetical protein